MKILAKSGLNLVGLEIERYALVLLPSHILVDGVAHGDDASRFARVDRWVREAKHAPDVAATSEAEILEALQATAEEDAAILAVTASRKLANVHEATLAAAKAFLYAASIMILVRRLPRAA